MTITDSYPATARDHPERIAILDRAGALRYPEFARLVARAARWLGARRPGPGRTLGLLAPNGREFLIWFAAAARAGWVAAPLDPRWTAAELADRVALLGPDLVVADDTWRHRLDGSAVEVCGLDAASASEDATPAGSPCGWLEHVPDRETCSNHPHEGTGLDSVGAPFYFGFTSGSTGRPKGFVRDQDSWRASFAVNADRLGWRGADRILVPGSLFGGHFLYAAVAGLWLGATVVVPPAFTPAGVVRGIRRGRCAHVAVVPTMLESLIEAGAGDRAAFHWYSTGAKCPPATEAAIRRLFPNSVLDEFYGASELSFVTARRSGDGLPADSVGRPLPGVSVRIVDPLGRPRPLGSRGLVQVASPWLFSHYVTGRGTDPGERDGPWLGIGDVGHLESVPGAGPCLFLDGRRDGMIVTGGSNVFPEEVEAVLRTVPGVRRAAVIGLDDRHWGQVVCAVVEPDAGRAVSTDELLHHCRAELSTPKVPRLWRVMRHIPLTAGGKPDRDLLRRLLASPDARPRTRWTRGGRGG